MTSDTDTWIYWLQEVTKEHYAVVGKKCANLGEMTRAGFHVPAGFALSLDAYDKFMRSTGALEEVKTFLASFTADAHDPAELPKWQQASDVLREIVESKPMPAAMADVILTHYADVCRKTGSKDCPVATRSAGAASHPGQYETFLHVTGEQEVLRNIIKVWSSTFNQRSLVARARGGCAVEYDPIGVAVLQMVNAKAAGVMLTLNPATGDRAKIMLGGNWGLGESVVSGSVTPDEWMVDKVVMEIIKRTISLKGIEYIVDTSGQVVVADIPPERQSVPCLTDEEVLGLAKGGKSIEQHYGEPQDIEWVIDKDLALPESIFFVQTRPETTWKEKAKEAKLSSTGDAKKDVVQFWMTVKA
jgi:pyruvate, water dikinase